MVKSKIQFLFKSYKAANIFAFLLVEHVPGIQVNFKPIRTALYWEVVPKFTYNTDREIVEAMYQAFVKGYLEAHQEIKGDTDNILKL